MTEQPTGGESADTVETLEDEVVLDASAVLIDDEDVADDDD